MSAVTRVFIWLLVDEEQSIGEAIDGLPEYCRSTFVEYESGSWWGEFVITCPVAPVVADGDFEDDFAPCFPALLKLKQFYRARFELQIAVGAPGPEVFEIPRHLVALLAALGASIIALPSSSKPRDFVTPRLS